MTIPSLDALIRDLTSGDDTRAEPAAKRLAEMGHAAADALYPLLKSADADTRWWALRTLAESEAFDLNAFLHACKDADSAVRQCAALGLLHHPDERAIPALIEALQDEDKLVSRLASDALAAIGKPAVPALADFLKNAPSAQQMAKINAVRALSLIADPQAIPALMQASEDDSLFMRHWAEAGLDALGLDMVYMKLD